MGLGCTKMVRSKLCTSDKQNETCKHVYLCNGEGEGVSSLQMRGLSETRPELTPKTIQTINASWAVIKKDIEHVGVVMFMGLLEDNQEVRSSFLKFKPMSDNELRASTQLRSHVLRVMGAVDKVVARLNEPDKLVAFLHDLGQKHMRYNTRPEFMDLIGPQFNNAVQPAMGARWTPEKEQAWADLFRYITHIMKETMVM